MIIKSIKSKSQMKLLKILLFTAEFPFIAYYVINNSQNNPVEVFKSIRSTSLRKFEPTRLRYTAEHTFDIFNEVTYVNENPPKS